MRERGRKEREMKQEGKADGSLGAFGDDDDDDDDEDRRNPAE